MFLNTSRYFDISRVEVKLKDGRSVNAVTLRRLPAVEGSDREVSGKDRLDIYSQRLYNNPTFFWHIADANTELEATDLVAESGRIISVPEK